MFIRLHKYLADRGVASRRKCEEYIRQGFIKVNGTVVREMGIKINPEVDRVEVTGNLHLREQQFVYYAFHKPAGYVTTVSGHETPKITELIHDIPERVFPVGRLDKLTSGLLILTNDGRFAYELTHPKFEKEKEYIVKVRETVGPAALAVLKKSIAIHGRQTKPASVQLQGPHLLRILLTEGRNRQIRRLCEKASLHIEKLKRIRIGTLQLSDLGVREYRKLTTSEISQLRGSLSLS